MKNDRLLTSLGGRDMSDAAAQTADELAKSLAMMHATLESTTDAILVTDESNQVRAFNEKYLNLWAIPPELRASRDANDFWNDLCHQLKDPAACVKRIREIIAAPVGESFDVLHLVDGRVFERNSAIQLVDQRSVGRVWSFRDITERKRAEDALENEKKVPGENRFRCAVANCAQCPRARGGSAIV